MISTGVPEYNAIMKKRQTEYIRDASQLAVNLKAAEFNSSVFSHGKMPLSPA
jgi:hypothetical protein